MIFFDYFKSLGWSKELAQNTDFFIVTLAVILVAIVLQKVVRAVLIGVLRRLAVKTESNFDDFLIAERFPQSLAVVVPIAFLFIVLPFWTSHFPSLRNPLHLVLEILIVLSVLTMARRVLMALRDSLKLTPTYGDKPIDSYVQVLMIALWVIGLVVIFSLITGKEILNLLAAMGALSALILLIFKDLILGFVASIQIAVNDLVRIGDWITIEKYGADGDVIEINLSTVKVQNFDKTITSVPTYSFISDAFVNWRGMSNSDGRRIKRSILIKTSSIRFVTDQEADQLKSVELMTERISNRQTEINTYNQEHQIDKSLAINGRNLTNMGLFRFYVDAYLNQHPMINHDMMIMCRQLPQTPQGTPLEIYAFSIDKRWKEYEDIVGNVFDHLFAALPYFMLELYEYPTGSDLKTFKKDLL
jgi:miniconductance mechanosensitive channel